MVVVSTKTNEQLSARGIYHLSDTERHIESKFRIPDFEALDPIKVVSELMSSAMQVDTKRKTLAGIELPFTLTGKPMNLEINGESRNEISLINNRKNEKKPEEEIRRTDISPDARQAFLRARHVCLEESVESCDEALDTFHRIRFGKSLVDDDFVVKTIQKRLQSDGDLDELNTDPQPLISQSSQVSRPSNLDYHDKALNFLKQIT
ncbi:unnamed protein product [Caenorhabditis bovis]|uniref:Uncharacterized protein n=1 Tax=Caenorhabditis bovis TaxID=2654633 RepID=A0A8S1FCC1_9PELO|nr:unnamed protein product [Caenorhabditis bovis]